MVNVSYKIYSSKQKPDICTVYRCSSSSALAMPCSGFKLIFRLLMGQCDHLYILLIVTVLTVVLCSGALSSISPVPAASGLRQLYSMMTCKATQLPLVSDNYIR